MTEKAAMITALAALISALAWPLVLVVAYIVFRKQLSAALESLPSIINRMNKIKVGMFEIGILEAELNKTAGAATYLKNSDGEVTQDQIESSARIQIQAIQLGSRPLIDQMEKLSIEYDRTRSAMSAGQERTQAMTKILAKMRALGPSVSERIEYFKDSNSPGSRLAAVAIMQLKPEMADMNWLLARFKVDHAFIFYHAALVLKNLSRSSVSNISSYARGAAEKALEIVENFSGPKDSNTIKVLRSIVDYR